MSIEGGTKVRVYSVDMESENGEVKLEVTTVRVPHNVYVSEPNPLDVPADFRSALQEWLDVGNAA